MKKSTKRVAAATMSATILLTILNIALRRFSCSHQMA